MKQFESLGFTAIVTDKELQIKVNIDNLVKGFNLNPENHFEETIKEDMKQEFAEYVAKNLIEGTHLGDSPIMQTIDSIFEEILESCESFVQYNEEDEE